jgi:hypothetical protein
MYTQKHPDAARSPESVEARLRALPQPPVPAHLEARLLAKTPLQLPVRPWRWAIWAGAVGSLAAACLLAVFVWPRHDRKRPVPSLGTTQSVGQATLPSTPPGESAHQVTLRPPDDSTSIAPVLVARRALDETELPTFIWPLPATSPMRVWTSIPPELLD